MQAVQYSTWYVLHFRHKFPDFLVLFEQTKPTFKDFKISFDVYERYHNFLIIIRTFNSIKQLSIPWLFKDFKHKSKPCGEFT